MTKSLDPGLGKGRGFASRGAGSAHALLRVFSVLTTIFGLPSLLQKFNPTFNLFYHPSAVTQRPSISCCCPYSYFADGNNLSSSPFPSGYGV